MKATTLTSTSILEIVLLIIFPVLAVRPGKEPELEFDPSAPKRYRPLSRNTGVEDDTVINITEETPLRCAHLVFNMVGVVHSLPPDASSSDVVDCFKICDKGFRDMSKVGFAGLSIAAHKNKWTNHGMYTSASYCPMRFSDTCRASGRICVDVIEAFDIRADYPSSPNQDREEDFAQGTCMPTRQVNSQCAPATTGILSQMSCMCKVRFQLYNSYVGYGIVLPADFFPGCRHDCRPSSICQRLLDRYPGWTCEVDGVISGECPRIKDYADGSQPSRQISMIKDDHQFCKCNRRGSRSCTDSYSKVLGLKFRALMPSRDCSRQPFARYWTEDWMQAYSEITDALDESDRFNDKLRLQIASVDAHIAKYSSSSQSLGIPQTSQALAPAQRIGLSTAAQVQLESTQSVPPQYNLPVTSPSRCDTDGPVSCTRQRQYCATVDAADANNSEDLFDEDEISRFASEGLECFDLPFL